ncbi:MAG TPA: 2-hydroxyacid dehydrogenase [Jiangellaceae bacterium]|nr:2-hydroxyacid dehydrogenase [Jiangellaceae bacterium]
MAGRRVVLEPFGLAAGIDAEDLEVLTWAGRGPLPDDVRRVEFYVMPYTFEPVTGEVITRMPRLRVVQTLTAGVEHVTAYLHPGVTLCNARGVHDASTAELAVTLTLASLRGIADFVRAQDRMEWTHGERASLADKTVLIVGYGSIGTAIEGRLRPFECDVLRVARRARDGVAGFESLLPLVERADVVVLTVPLTAQTRGLVDAAFLARMRDGTVLVNVSRGPVVDTDALLTELSAGRLTAALDVTDPEPPPAGHPLWSAPGLLLTPHVGGDTSAFRPRAIRLVIDQLKRFANNEPLANVVVDGTFTRSG